MNFSISRKLAALIGVATLASIIAVSLQLSSLQESIWKDRKVLLQSQIDTAKSIVEHYADEAASGRLSQEEAQRRAADAVRSIRYGKGDYLFIHRFDGFTVVHPSPQREGLDGWGDVDANGFHQTRALIANAKGSGGFTEYVWPRLNATEPSPKLAYSEGFKPWQWSIATGTYVDDLKAEFMEEVYKALMSWGILFAVLIACAIPLARSISRPINRMTDAMRRLAAGDKAVEIPAVGRKDEIGAMAAAVQVFKEQAIERDRLEQEAEAARVSHAEARQRQADLEHAKAEDLREFMGVVDASFDRLSSGDLTVRMSGKVAPE
ncbi:cache domain-containing protein, partial [Jiella mangrovi]